MRSYDTHRSPDYSPYLVHFTKSRRMSKDEAIVDGHPLYGLKDASALEKLVSILKTRTIHAAPMPYLPNAPEAVCFTECVWESLILFADEYSRYGVVFSKRLVFEQGGGPALYLRGDQLLSLGAGIPPDLEPLVVPFDPTGVLTGQSIQTLEEREWRLPKSLRFEYSDVLYVIVDSVSDSRHVLEQIGAKDVPEHKILPMQVYVTAVDAWRSR